MLMNFIWFSLFKHSAFMSARVVYPVKTISLKTFPTIIIDCLVLFGSAYSIHNEVGMSIIMRLGILDLLIKYINVCPCFTPRATLQKFPSVNNIEVLGLFFICGSHILFEEGTKPHLFRKLDLLRENQYDYPNVSL